MTHTLPPLILGLGANLGDVKETLKRAALALHEGLGGAEFEIAGLYRSAPIGPVQPDFYNSALLLYSSAEPSSVLELIVATEQRFGRQRGERWGPRTLDVDVLWAGWRSDRPELQVPHPRLSLRAFAFEPFLELYRRLPAPEAFPLPDEFFAPHLRQLRAAQQIERIQGPDWLVDGVTARGFVSALHSE